MSENTTKDPAPSRSPYREATRGTGTPAGGFVLRSVRSASFSATSAQARSTPCRPRSDSSRSRASHPSEIIGVVSLIIWALVIVVTAKYVALPDDGRQQGRGRHLLAYGAGELALGRLRPFVFLLGSPGRRFSGDAIITPAISVLSALEGLKQVDTDFTPYVFPATLVILVMLFVAQSRGTAKGCGVLRPDHGGVLRGHRRYWALPMSLRPAYFAGSEPACPASVSAHSWHVGFSCSAASFWRSPAPKRFCGYGSFRAAPDPGGLAVPCAAGADPQLSGSGRPDSEKREGGRKSLLLMAPVGGFCRSSFCPPSRPSSRARPLSPAPIAGRPGDAARTAAPSRNHSHLRSSQEGQIFIPRVISYC